MVQTFVKDFNELTTQELYDLLRLRSEVFVLEQTCLYEDMDGMDQMAKHILLYVDDKLVGYARIFKQGIYFKEAAIGRVLIKEDYRGRFLAHKLMKVSIAAVENYYQTDEIRISAQTHLEKFYNSHGFLKIGKGYLEDGIPHINMIK